MMNTKAISRFEESFDIPNAHPLWQLDFVELTGHNLEARGRKEVNRLLEAGWKLLHIYTLIYKDDGVWRERPMAILGRLRQESAGAGTLASAQAPGPAAGKNRDLRSVISLPSADSRRA